jgi:hypothetical protein
MGPMSKNPDSATVNASIAKICSSKGHRTVVRLNSSRYQDLPMTLVTVTLKQGELFMATGGNGKVAYTDDLEAAYWFTNYNGSEAVPDAIQVLRQCIDENGIRTFETLSVCERATPLPCAR